MLVSSQLNLTHKCKLKEDYFLPPFLSKKIRITDVICRSREQQIVCSVCQSEALINVSAHSPDTRPSAVDSYSLRYRAKEG